MSQTSENVKEEIAIVDEINRNGKGAHQAQTLSPMGQAALAYTDAGLSVVPLCWTKTNGECGCFKHHTHPRDIGKAPLIGKGYQDVRLTRAHVIGWWLRNPLANVGILLEPGGFLVIDSDSPEADREVEQRGVPPGPRVKTPHGIHRYFSANESTGRTTKKGGSGKIDVLSLGYAVVPPSRTPAGVYTWEIGLHDIELEDAPAWATSLLAEQKTKPPPITVEGDLAPVELTALGLEGWLLEVITTGQTSHPNKYPSRSEAVFAVEVALLRAGCSVETIASILLDPRYKISEKPRQQGQKWLLDDIARAQAKQQTEHAEMNGGAPPEPVWIDEDTLDTPVLDIFRCTDLGNGERFIARYGPNLQYCNQWKKYLTWDAKRWKLDDSQQVRQWARSTIRSIYDEAQWITEQTKNAEPGEEKDKLAKRATALLKHAVKSEAEARTNALIHNAQMDCAVMPKQLDADPWLLNVENGTLDLRTGTLRPHRREDLITKIIPITYDPEARCPMWEAFLGAVMAGNQDLVDFLWKSLGYSLTGNAKEDCLFLLYGAGANGKSTFQGISRTLAGDYGRQAEFSTLLHRERDVVRNDLADLRGARLVTAGETEQDKRLSESVVKQLTGRDFIKARFLFQEYFEFMPQMKLWLAANYKPIIRGTDYGIWRRIRLVPFTVKFEGDKKDVDLPDKLQTELPGILAWAVRGCTAWQQDGLPMPEAVQSATDAYRKEMDVMGNFLEDCCELKPHLRAKAGDLYNAYVTWSGDKHITQTAFGRELNDRSIGRDKSGGTVWRLGIALTTAQDS